MGHIIDNGVVFVHDTKGKDLFIKKDIVLDAYYNQSHRFWDDNPRLKTDVQIKQFFAYYTKKVQMNEYKIRPGKIDAEICDPEFVKQLLDVFICYRHS